MNFHEYPNSYFKAVAIKVENIEKSLKFYQEMIGFQVLEQSSHQVILTVKNSNTPILTIEQPETVVPKEQRRTGLYHFAILLPDRVSLAMVLRHLLENRYPLQGASDHLVSEALYLADPDGNGIEIYVDRPSTSWEWSGEDVVMDTIRLDAENLLSLSQETKWSGLSEGTIMGHIHLHVSELQNSKEFYTKGLGFNVVNQIYGDSALFLSTGGYHHHIGINIWNGKGAPPASENSVGLSSFTVQLPNVVVRSEIVQRVKQLGYNVTNEGTSFMVTDPSGNNIKLEI
ncbi:VOC family protein [Litchfieldia alkalitelluris]|uniref:VOC family protein n=1 Tax=Litchfieldia alkalitelluris TaxID=304268 RepID=UPI0009961494|nr:VOC family protein [Litchfieldia alkalitelluris]